MVHPFAVSRPGQPRHRRDAHEPREQPQPLHLCAARGGGLQRHQHGALQEQDVPRGPGWLRACQALQGRRPALFRDEAHQWKPQCTSCFPVLRGSRRLLTRSDVSPAQVLGRCVNSLVRGEKHVPYRYVTDSPCLVSVHSCAVHSLPHQG